jgi:hypothetical protein
MVREIPLTQGKTALVDDEDFALVAGYKWCALRKKGNHWYAVRGVSTPKGVRHIYMHRVIANPPEGMVTDHINGDGLDNRRSNIRVATKRQNAQNTSIHRNNTCGFKGVSISRRGHITAKCQGVYLGLFKTVEDAARRYDEEALIRYGEFARLNFPEERTAA